MKHPLVEDTPPKESHDLLWAVALAGGMLAIGIVLVRILLCSE